MPIQDRTNEFRACVDSIRSRSALTKSSAASQHLIVQNAPRQASKSEFSRMASGIGKDISSTTIKLNKLAQRKYRTLPTTPLK